LFDLWAGIFCLGAALGRKVYLEYDRLHFPNFFLMLIGPPGCGKGVAMNDCYSILSCLEGQMEHQFTLCAESTTPQGFLHYFSMASRFIKDMPPEYDSNIISPFIVLSSEMTVLLQREYSSLVESITDLYDFARPVWRHLTKTDDLCDEIRGPFLSILGATTTDKFHKVLPVEVLRGGFLARVTGVYSEDRGFCINAKKTPEEKELAATLRSDLVEIAKLKGGFEWTPEWEEKYIHWRRLLRDRNPGSHLHLTEYFERRPTHFIKLCQVLAVSSSDNLLFTSEVFDRALQISKITEREMPKIYRGFGRNPLAEVLVQVEREILLEGKTDTGRLSKIFEAVCTYDELLECIKALARRTPNPAIIVRKTDRIDDFGDRVYSVEVNKKFEEEVEGGTK
jgi:hypothetical protein